VSADQPDQPADDEDDLALAEPALLRLGADIPDPTTARHLGAQGCCRRLKDRSWDEREAWRFDRRQQG